MDVKAKLVCDGGETLEIPLKVYQAFFIFMRSQEQRAGKIEIHFHDASVSRVITTSELK